MTNVIVKVGKKSNLSFSHAKVHRAITALELEYLVNNNNNSILIIEEIKENEVDSIAKSIESVKNKEGFVWVTCSNNFGIEPTLNTEDLFKDIYKRTKLNLSTNIKLRNEISLIEEDTQEQDEFLTFDNDSKDNELDENIVEENVDTVLRQALTEESNDNIEEQVDETLNIVDEPVIEEVEIHKDIKEPIKEEKETEEVGEYSSKLVEETIAKYEDSLQTIKQLTLEVDSLNRLNQVLRDKYDNVIKEYNEIVDNDTVLEDPISLSEYEGIKSESEKKEETIENLQKSISKFEKTIESLNETLESEKSSNEELRRTIEDINEELQVKVEELNVEKTNKQAVKEAENEAKRLQNLFDKTQEVLSDKESEIETLKEMIEDKSINLDYGLAGREISLDFVDNLLKKLHDTMIESNKLKSINSENEELISNLRLSGKGNSQLIEQKSNEITQLKAKLVESESKVRTAVTAERREKEELQRRYDSLKEQLEIQTTQLTLMTDQYEKIAQVAGVDENGAESLIDKNRTLEDMVDTLREQLNDRTVELEQAKTTVIEAEEKVEKADEEVKALQSKVKALSSLQLGGKVGGGTVKMLPIKNNGRARIVSIMGSGSFGITTTAMSIAYKLASNAKVLFMDLDIVSPKADTWFLKSPLCKNVMGFNPSDSSYTALGLFFTKGTEFIMQNAFNVITSIETSRSGQLDYFGGLYAKLDSTQIASSDFNSLINFLSNSYDYIVVDLGRLGNSELNDSIIKNFVDASNQTVCVTLSTPLEVRNFLNKLNNANIDKSKLSWLLNMCTTSRLDDRAAKMIGSIGYSVLPFDGQAYGAMNTFSRSGRMLKDRFDYFLTNIVFKR